MKILNATLFQEVGGVETMFRNYGKALHLNNADFDLLISAQGIQDYESCGSKACLKISPNRGTGFASRLLGSFVGLIIGKIFPDNRASVQNSSRIKAESLKTDSKKIFKIGHKVVIFDFLKLLAIALFHGHKIIICHQPRLMRWAAIISKISKIFCLNQIKSVAVVHGLGIKHALRCDYVIAVNSEIAAMIAAKGFDLKKIFILPNAIEIDQEFKPKTVSLNKPITIGAYGRIEHGKGFDILLDAAKILKEQNIDFRIKIGGTDVHNNYSSKDLEQIAKKLGLLDFYDFVGEVSNKKEFFKDVDILCVPSRHESFGMVILEGFLFSTLVISSNTTGGMILIKNQENGLLFLNENSEDLAQKIIAVIEKKIDYEKLTRTSYSRLENEFSLTFFAKQLHKILHEIHEN